MVSLQLETEPLNHPRQGNLYEGIMLGGQPLEGPPVHSFGLPAVSVERAVEIAIEESEAAAVAYLADVVREDGLNDAVAGESHPGVVPA